jgi:hypothetical protein
VLGRVRTTLDDPFLTEETFQRFVTDIRYAEAKMLLEPYGNLDFTPAVRMYCRYGTPSAIRKKVWDAALGII